LANALYRIGWIYNDLEDYDSALTYLQRVVSLRPSDAAAYFELGYANKADSSLSPHFTTVHTAAFNTIMPHSSSPVSARASIAV
jgi:tetratricopeptide (TPR) repeat protein